MTEGNSNVQKSWSGQYSNQILPEQMSLNILTGAA